MQFYRAEVIDNLNIPVGTTVKLESLRQAVIPPFLMLMPFIEVPDGIVVEEQYALDEDGVHGCVYLLRAEAACEGDIVIGFRDIQTNEVTHRKEIRLTTGGNIMKELEYSGIWWYSPLTAVAVGPAGPPSMLAVSPHSSPSTALKVTATSPVKENDFQWVLLGLTVPSVVIKGVKVCYAITTESETYISQVRLTQMTTPDSALVVHDDGTNLTSTSPTCYTSPTKVEVKGTITLALKMVFGSTSDVILIGGIALLTE